MAASGGVGQQNAKVKVTFDSPSALKNRRISPEGQSSAMSSPPCKHKPPTGRHMALRLVQNEKYFPSKVPPIHYIHGEQANVSLRSNPPSNPPLTLL